MSEIGPVQLVAVGFGPDANYEGAVMAELVRLERSGTVRLLDLLFVQKEEDGDLAALDYQGEDLGAIIGALLGFEFEGDDGPAPADAPEQAHAFGLTQDQIQGIAASLEPGHAAGLMLIEHVWARDLKRVIRDAGGIPLGEGFLTPETAAMVAAELLAMSTAVEEVEAEDAAAAPAT